MSIGIDLLKATEEELQTLRLATDKFKLIRRGLQNSYVYRIASPLEHPYAVFEYLCRDRSTFTVFAFGHGLNRWDYFMPLFRMRGLDPDAVYEYENTRMTGAALMNVGIKLPLMTECVGGDYKSCVLTFNRVK